MNVKKIKFLISLAPLMTLASLAYAQESPAKNDWVINGGFGVMSNPQYPGSSTQKTRVAPTLGATNGRFFFGSVAGAATVPFGLGMFLYKDSNWQTGIVVSYDLFSPRKESDDETHLHGLGDIQRTEHVTLLSRYTKDWYALSASLTSSGNGQGMQLRLGSEAKYNATPSLTLTAGPSLTWSNASYNQTFFGINATQSAASGLSRYAPSSGVSDVSFAVGASYKLTPQWNIGTRLGLSYLPSNISDSPIVEKTTSFSFGVFAGYKF